MWGTYYLITIIWLFIILIYWWVCRKRYHIRCYKIQFYSTASVAPQYSQSFYSTIRVVLQYSQSRSTVQSVSLHSTVRVVLQYSQSRSTVQSLSLHSTVRVAPLYSQSRSTVQSVSGYLIIKYSSFLTLNFLSIHKIIFCPTKFQLILKIYLC